MSLDHVVRLLIAVTINAAAIIIKFICVALVY